MICPGCGTELRADAKFCDECGAPVSVATTAEYKQVTVLFADVVHSMDIAATLGSERLRELMSELFDRYADIVQRYRGTVDKFTGDGVMAVFGAPISLEDHAIRACLAALDIQVDTQRLAAEVQQRDGLDLQLRVGLNSGEVIAGEVGSRSHSYTMVGEHVGMAERMQSVAPPGGVMVSESTARLVERMAVLGELEFVPIKGTDAPVPARTLLSMGTRAQPTPRGSTFVGREWELAALTAMLDHAVDGHGCVTSVVGPPGIGKSRLVAELASLAEARGVRVCSTYCESHTTEVAFQAATRLLRSDLGVEGMDPEAARARVRARVPEAGSADLILVYDELGIRDPADRLPDIAPEARRRRLTALVNAAVMERKEPVLYVIEDVHWIDSTSESLLADFVSVVPRTHSLALITYRPEYDGVLSRSRGAQTIALAPLDDAQTVDLVTELLGRDPSVSGLTDRIAERASGNPFFAEEIVRDLAGRGVLTGGRGGYLCADAATDVDVPATLQSAIAARIDRLAPTAKRTLNAAAVIGMRFEETLLATLAESTDVAPLIRAELIDQVVFTSQAEHAFHHPLIRTVAYRSQLKSARAELHRRLAATLEARDPESADENAALIAEHHEAAGDLKEAFDWHMRAGAWLTFREISAARSSWQRARQVADQLSADDPGRQAMRIAPRALLCGSAFRVGGDVDEAAFEELSQLARAVDDKVFLAMARAGYVLALLFRGRYHESSRLAYELISLIDAIGDPDMTVGLYPAAASPMLAVGQVADALASTQRVIDLAADDPFMGNFIVESPLSIARMCHAAGLLFLGAPNWKQEIQRATAMCREYLPMGHSVMLFWSYVFGLLSGAMRPDEAAVRETAEVVTLAERIADDLSLESARFLHGFVLAQRDGADRNRGMAMLAKSRDAAAQQRSLWAFVSLTDVEVAKEQARAGDFAEAVRLLQTILDGANGIPIFQARAAVVLVESLLQRGTPADVQEATSVVERLAAMPVESGIVVYEIGLLRLRALLAQIRGDEAEFRQFADRYRAMATELGFKGHIAMAEAMQ